MSDLVNEEFLQSCQGQTVWVLAPHPDDEVFGCGGTLALLAARQARVVVDIVSDGAFGKFGENPAQRVEESQAAAALLGYVTPNFWNFPDQGLRFGEGLIQSMLARLQELKPHVVFIPSVWEVHPDHLAVCAAAREAIRQSGQKVDVWMYEVGQALRPNVYIDITAVFEQKKRAMACFASQLRVQAYDRHISALNTYRTYQLPANVLAAEAFHRLNPLMQTAGGNVLDHLLQPVALQSTHQPVPLVSVLIRSSNRPELMQALRSVAGQTYSNIEICIVNATGQAHRALPEYVGTWPLRLLDVGQPLGRSAAANALLEAARGSYALFLDDDDWLLPGHIAALAGKLQSDGSVLAAYSDTVCLEQDGAGQWQEVRRFEGDVQIGALPFDNKLPIHAVLFRRSAVPQLRFDTAFDLFEDWDWWLQLTQHGAFAHVPGASAIYRIHAASGLGVRANADKARAALEQIVGKWHLALSPEQVVQRLAYVRQLAQSLFAEQQRSTELRRELDITKQHTEQLIKDYEAAIAQQDDMHRMQLQAAEQKHVALQQMLADLQHSVHGIRYDDLADLQRIAHDIRDAKLAELHVAIHDVRRTSAWSIVGILRRIKHRLQGTHQTQTLPESAGNLAASSSTSTQLQQMVQGQQKEQG